MVITNGASIDPNMLQKSRIAQEEADRWQQPRVRGVLLT